MKRKWHESLISPTATVADARRIIDESSMHVTFVVDENKKLLGIATQSDFRKALLKRLDLQSCVTEIMNHKPKTALVTDDENKIKQFFIKTKLTHLPIINENGILVDVKYFDKHLKIDGQDHWVVIMAGGEGNRLKPITENVPKPLLNVGEKTILETIIKNCVDYGFKKFYLSVNYKAQMIEDFLGDGSALGIEIKYLKEKKQMGTAGSISLLPELPSKPILVINGDLVTDLNLQHLINFHSEHYAVATMCVREYEFTVPFGVVKLNGSRIGEIDEKPIQSFFVNAGVYVLEPEVLKLIPKNKLLNMTDLLKRIIDDNQKTAVFPIHEYWLDVGQISDYQKAMADHRKMRK